MSGLNVGDLDTLIEALVTLRQRLGSNVAVAVVLGNGDLTRVAGAWVGQSQGVDVALLDTRPNWRAEPPLSEGM